MKTETIRTRVKSVTHLAPRKPFWGATVIGTLAALLFTASSLLAAAGASSVIAPALDEWVRQSPLPSARNLTGVAWATSTHGFASGESLTLV